MPKNTYFVSKRQDGLGERLRAILNAIALSKVYDSEFKFFWNDTKFNEAGHSIELAGKIFDNEYLDQHLLDISELPSCKPVKKTLNAKEEGWYFCNQTIRKEDFLDDKDKFNEYREELKKAFWKIDFSSPIQSVIDKANNLKLDAKSIALHLRAGDLIYGPSIQSCSYIGKAISYPVAIKIIEEAKVLGREVLIFGQDQKLIRVLSEFSNAYAASDLVPLGLGRAETAFFEVVLMSRCDTIYAGNSGFAVLASLINDNVFLSPGKNYNKRSILDMITNSLDKFDTKEDISNSQASFACKTALLLGKGILKEDKYLELIDFGRKVDPDNILYFFLDAWQKYEKGNADEADDIIDSLLADKREQFDSFVSYNFGTQHQVAVFRNIFDASIIEKYIKRPATAEIYKLLTTSK